MAELEGEVQELMALAEAADQVPESTPLKIPAELARRKDRLMKLALARQEIEARFKERQKDRQAEYEAKVAAREDQRAQGHRVKGRDPQPPPNQPDDKAQYNFTDPESRIMKAGSGAHFEQNERMLAMPIFV